MPPAPPTPPVCCVIVTYNVGELFRTVFEAVAPQVDHVVVVDNASDEPTRRLLAAVLRESPSRLTLLSNPVNTGLAAAMNTGVARALGLGYDWILTLDHDSIAGPDMVANLLAAYGEVASRNPGIVSPLHIDQGTGRKYRYPSFGRLLFRHVAPAGRPAAVSFCMSSGALIRREVVEAVGPFREDYFVYAIDNEFCRRLTQKGYAIFVSDKALLYHREGRTRTIDLRLVRWRWPDWGALSLYYIFRNMTYDMRISRTASSRLHGTLFLAKTLLGILADGRKDRKERLRAACRGIADGIHGRLGKAADR